MNRPQDEFFQPKIKVLGRKMEEYIAYLEGQRRCPFLQAKCVYHEGSNCENHAVCPGNSDAYCNQLYALKESCDDILLLLGNVDYSNGGGVNTAKARGDLLNDIRKLLNEYMPEEDDET